MILRLFLNGNQSRRIELTSISLMQCRPLSHLNEHCLQAMSFGPTSLEACQIFYRSFLPHFRSRRDINSFIIIYMKTIAPKDTTETNTSGFAEVSVTSKLLRVSNWSSSRILSCCVLTLYTLIRINLDKAIFGGCLFSHIKHDVILFLSFFNW